MKKVIKMSLVVIVGLFIFLNVNLTLNDSKVEGFNFTLKTKTALADYMCWLDLNDFTCETHNLGYFCGRAPTEYGTCVEFE